MDKRIYCIAKFCFISIVMTLILSGLLAACSLEGDIQTLRKKPMEKPSSSVAPSAPATAPTVIAGSEQLTVSWRAVEKATAYEVWAGTANNSNTATKRGGDVSGLSAVITGLTNSTTYYVWVKAKNSVGTSGFSPVASGTPSIPIIVPQAPSTPTVSIGDGQITVTWTAVEGAEKYEVYISTAQNPPASPERTVLSTTTVLTDLTNRTIYYVWVKAANENGASDFSPRARGIPWPANAVPAVPERPVIIPGINQLTVTWEETGGASSYEVYISTTTTTPSSATATSNKTSAVINNLQNNVIYYIWVRAVNGAGKSDYSPVEAGTPRIPTVAPSAPSAPVLTVGSRELTVSWQAVELAEDYEVWFGTSDDSTQAQKFGSDITGGITETLITGLTNETTYYVWIKAKNVVGTSGFSLPGNARPSAFIFLPETPATPTVIPGNRELTVSWTAVEGALFYEVWTGATNNSANATKHGADATGASTTLTGLDNWTTYYVWIKAKNNIGISGFSPVASGAPLGTNNERSPGLYRNNAKIGNQNLSEALSYISSNAVSGDDFYIVLGANESTSPMTLNYSGKTVEITLLGYGGERTITLASNGSMFTINTGVTLTLDENITLMGLSTNTTSLVYLNAGNLFINTGAKISGNTTSNSGGGIYVNSNGTITMNGGTISGNTSNSGGGIFISAGGTVTMNSGTIKENTANYGGGIHVVGTNGTLTIYGGTISGNTSSVNGGGIYVNTDGTLTMYGGTISGNTSSANGGGIGIYEGIVIMHGGVISGNTSNSGGGINTYGGTVTINGGTISGNTSSGRGGGIYVQSGTVTINGGTISGNTSSSGGGGIGVVSNGTLIMNGGTISGNEDTGGYGGGGIYVDSNGTLTIYDGIISGNTAARFGGGVHMYTGSPVFTMHGGGISGNTAGDGGGVHFYSGTFKKIPSGDGQNSGIIYGNEETGVDAGGVPLKNTSGNSNGHAVYSSSVRRNTTAGQTDHIDSTTGRGLSANGYEPFGE